MKNFLKKNHTYIVAELSANHNQDFQIAKDSLYAAKECKADAIKVQTYRADTLTLDVKSPEFLASDSWNKEYLYDLYKKAYMPWEWQKDLKDYAKSLELDFFSSPFDFTSVDFLEGLGVEAYKIASFEITDLPLIKYVASKQKPVIISTGIANLDDISNAIKVCENLGNTQLILLKCTSSYPAPSSEANLKSIKFLKDTFSYPVGFSDHTLGVNAPICAVSLGACFVEKHFILNKNIKSADASFSLDKEEFSQMVKAIRETEKLLGDYHFKPTKKSLEARHYSRSLFAKATIKKGELFTKDNIGSFRPNLGLAPKFYEQILDKIANTDLVYGQPLEEKFIKDFKE